MKRSNLIVLNSFMSFTIASLMAIPHAHAKGGGSTGGADLVYVNHEKGIDQPATLAEIAYGSGTRKMASFPVGYIYDQLFPSPKTVELKNEVSSQIVDLILKVLIQKGSTEAPQVRRALDSLSFQSVGFVNTLSTGFHPNPFLAEKSQLAEQDFSNHTVRYLGERVQEYFGNVARAFLMVHEGYIRYEHDQGKDLKASEKIVRITLGALVNSPEFQKEIENYFLQSGSDFSPIYDRLWALAYDSVDNDGWFGSCGPDGETVLKAFGKLLSNLEIPCAMNSDVVIDIEKLDKEKDDIYEAGGGALCSKNASEPEKSPTLKPEETNTYDPSKPVLIADGSDFETLHPSVGGSLHILVKSLNGRCGGLPLKAEVKNPKNTDQLLTFTGKTDQDLLIPVDQLAFAPGKVFDIQVHVQACKSYPSTYSIMLAGDHNHYVTVATPTDTGKSTGDISPGAWGAMFFMSDERVN